MAENNDVSNELDNTENSDNPSGNENPEVTVESLMAQLAQERADKERNKAALDKALKEKGEVTKQLRAKQTAEEQEAEAKKEQQEQHETYVKGLEHRIQMTEATNRYVAMGMDSELAKKTAEAELDGTPEGKDTVFANIQKMTDAKIKEKQAEWLKSRPEPQIGTDEEGKPEDAFIKGFES